MNNPTFYDGLNKWNTENETTFFLVGNKWIWANGNVLSRKGNSAIVCTDDGRTVVRIRNKYILQEHENLRSIPSFDTNGAGEHEAIPVYLSFFYRCAKSGTLKVEFENVDKTGFANFNSFFVEEELAVTDGYKQYTCNGLWNGTGDFRLSFTGDIYLYMLVLSTDKIESLTHKYKTLFEQSERLVKISAAVFDKDENALKETGLFIKPEGAGLYAQDADGNVALIGVSVDETDAEGNKIGSTIKLTANNIQLEGLVTANGNFKILEDGSIETNNAKLKGYMYSVFKPIDSSDAEILETGKYKLRTNLFVDATFCDVVLPVSEEYEGARVLILDSHFVKTRTATPPTTISTEDGSRILSGLFRQKYESYDKRWDIWAADKVIIDSGTIELTLLNQATRDEETGEVLSYGLQWVLIGNSCQYLAYELGDEYYEYQYNH